MIFFQLVYFPLQNGHICGRIAPLRVIIIKLDDHLQIKLSLSNLSIDLLWPDTRHLKITSIFRVLEKVHPCFSFRGIRSKPVFHNDYKMHVNEIHSSNSALNWVFCCKTEMPS